MTDITRFSKSFELVEHLIEGMCGPKGIELDQDIAVSLYVIANRTFALTQISLEITSGKNADFCTKGREDLVIMVRRGQEVFAFVHNKVEQELKNQKCNLTLDGKQIKNVQALNDTDYEALLKISEVVRGLLKKETTKTPPSPSHNRTDASRAHKNARIAKMLFKIENAPEKIKSSIIRRMIENQNEINRNKKEEDRKFRIKHDDIERFEIKRSIQREEVRKDEVKRQDLRLDLTNPV